MDAPPPHGPPIPVDDRAQLLARIRALESQLAAAHDAAVDQLVDLDDQRVLQEVGIYRYRHPLEDAAAYKQRLDQVNAEITAMVKAGTAILSADMFTFEGSLAKGRRMVTDLSKLMLRAYNAEADNCVRSLRSANVITAEQRLQRSMDSIERLGRLMQLRINPDYHALRLTELQLVADWNMKKQEEREAERERRAELREQRRVEAELAAERERLDKERAHYITALEQLGADDPGASDLRARLEQIDDAITANDYRQANIRAGYVYVISNQGAFGPGVVKIGMTRRLEPRDRIRDLGDASVPFFFDTHALFFSDDAVTLEKELHEALADRRLNYVNMRREFFFATPQEVKTLLESKVGGLLEYRQQADAEEYSQSRSLWPTHSGEGQMTGPGG